MNRNKPSDLRMLRVNSNAPIEPLPVSRNACNLHLINSVGHNVNEEKNAAKKPAVAFSNALQESFFVANCTIF